MEDYYKDGYDHGYGRNISSDHEQPVSESDRASFDRGRIHGEQRRRISDELDRDYFGHDPY